MVSEHQIRAHPQKDNLMTTPDSVSRLEKIIGYKFNNTNLVSIALSHPGLKKGDKNAARNFERLEFLGDRVLGLSLSSFLYEKFDVDTEGELAVRIAILAGTDFLIDLAKQKKIIDCFSIPKDFFISKHKNSSSFADMMEAVFGAVFLDSDFETARKVIVKLWENDIGKIVYKKKDSKTLLQEIVQSNFSELPVYRLVKMSGEAHDPIFEVEATVKEKVTRGYGNSKKAAEHDAAKKMITKLQEQKVEN